MLRGIFYFVWESEAVEMKQTRQRKPYKRIKYEDRQQIERLYSEGKTTDEIALTIGVNSRTMYRELERGGEPYRAEVAQRSL